jgi:hypothetical protein
LAEAHDSPGLKIAVAAFISISVIQAVALYFVYSAYTAAQARLAAVDIQNQQLQKSQTLLQTHYNELMKQMSKVSEPRKK